MSRALGGPIESNASSAGHKSFNFSARTSSVGNKAGNVAKKAVKVTAAAAGIGVLGMMSGTVALGKKTKAEIY